MTVSLSRCLENSPSSFPPGQIVCLEYQSWCLYAEVIQTIEVRQTCWLRPLIIVKGRMLESENLAAQAQCFEDDNCLYDNCFYDLRQDSDLLIPTHLLKQALDVEVIPLLSRLYTLSQEELSQEDALSQEMEKTTDGKRFQLRQFIQQICLAHPEAFQANDFKQGGLSSKNL